MINRLFLFTLLMIAELLMMQVMQKLEIASSFFWLEIFLDASVVSLFTVTVVRFLISRDKLKPREDLSLESVQLRTGLIALGVETMLMLSFPLLKLSATGMAVMLIDGICFALVTTLLIHFLLLKPANIIPENQSTLFDKILALRSFLLFIYLFSLSLFLLLLLNVYQQQQQTYITQAIDREQQQLTLIRNSLNDQVSKAALDTLMLARQENLQHLIKEDSEALVSLTKDYLSLATLKPAYDQIRFINAKGIETIRINQATMGPVTVAANKLQDKHNRYYFTDAFRLSDGEIYLSPLDLNIENGRIELPYKPIVRTASPVFDHQGKKLGIVIINLNASALFNQLKRDAESTAGELMLLNKQGYWLFGHEREAAWAFMFPEFKDRTIEKYYPGVWQQISMNDRGFISSPYGYFIYDTITTRFDNVTNIIPDKRAADLQWPEWKLVSLASTKDFSLAFNNILPPLVMFFILTTIITGTGMLMYFRIQRKHLIAQQQIQHLAHHDMLTGLCNRRLFLQILELQIAHCKRKKDPLALIYMDLDHFKPINDEYGHDAGDIVLKQVARKLKLIIRETDTLARLGGDEFAAILPAHGDRQQLELIAQRIISAMEQPVIFNGQPLNVGISIGIAIHFKGLPLESLLHEADQAMYEAKRDPDNSYKFAEEIDKN